MSKKAYKVFVEVDLLPQTKVTRRVHLRVDSYGFYLLFFEGEDLKAGEVLQWSNNPNLSRGYLPFSW